MDQKKKKQDESRPFNINLFFSNIQEQFDQTNNSMIMKILPEEKSVHFF